MSRRLWFCLMGLSLLTGCGGGKPDDGTASGEGATPPADAVASDGQPPTTDPGQIVTPTVDDSPQRAKAREMDITSLVKALTDAEMSDAASDELATRGEDAVKPLVDALESDDHATVQKAIFTLGQLGPSAQDALPKLNELAENSDSEVIQDSAKFAMDAIKGE